MTKRLVCVIGNSHAAMLKAGLELVPGIAETISFEFFAAQSDLMRNTELRGTVIAPTTELTKRRIGSFSAGKVEIESADYAEFLVIGLGFNVIKAMDVLKDHGLFGFEGPESNIASYISRACFAAVLESTLRSSTAMHFSRMLRGVSAARIVVIPQPYPSEKILQGGQSDFWKRAAASGLLEYVAQLYEATARRVIAEAGCEYLPQPPETLQPGPFTQDRFSQDSIRLAKDMNHKHPPAEPYHMNAIFGSEVLKRYAAMMARE